MRTSESRPDQASAMTNHVGAQKHQQYNIIHNNNVNKQNQQQQHPSSRLEAGKADSRASSPSPQPPPSRSPTPPPPPATASSTISPVKRLTIDVLFICLRGFIAVYDLITQPVFYFKDKVYERKHQIEGIVRSRQINPSDPNSPWRQIVDDPTHAEINADIDSMKNIDDMLRTSYRRKPTLGCYAYRRVLHEQWVKRPDSDKLFRQVRLSDYRWVTYGQLDEQVEATKRGFLLAGIKAGDTVMIYADTRPEWQICSQALTRLGATVGTMFATLGVDGIVHSVNETGVTHMVTQRDKVSKLLRLKSRLPKLAKIIYFDLTLDMPVELGGDVARNGDEKHPNGRRWQFNNNNEDDGDLKTSSSAIKENGIATQAQSEASTEEKQQQQQFEAEFEHEQVECIPLRQLVLKGLNANEAEIEQFERRDARFVEKIDKNSIAVIMYTSGSTGIPKGVIVTHGNVMSTTKSFSHITKDFVKRPRDNLSTAYLPLAHIFEFSLESMMLYHGVPFGFATPHTLTDKSPGLQPGQRGDLTILRPTISIIVPLILDRVVQSVKQVISQAPYFKSKLISYLIDYKIYWQRKHYETPLVDKIVCSKIAASLGGRIRYCISGSAPLSAETQSYVSAAMNMQLVQGFGSTETCAAATCQIFGDPSRGNVGIPVAGTMIKLEPWLEGNYRPTDKPNPRGEIVIGGGVIAAGYYKLDKQTDECFYTDKEGIRWYRTGDIGEFLPTGNLKIIDRKKDLVKLQNGEFVSLGRIEASLKSNEFTDNFCVYANSNYNYVVALGPANPTSLRKLAREIIDDSKHSSASASGSSSDNDDQHANDLRSRGGDEQRQKLVINQSESAIEELRDILREYDEDPDADCQEIGERKMSTLSTHSQACYDERLKRLCDNELIRNYILDEITRMGRERNLTSLELPKKILLLAEEWTEDKNLVTAALKIRRNYIYKRYEEELKNIYKQS